MRKEKLTIDNIKQDLSTDARNHLKEFAGMLAAFTVALVIIIVCAMIVPNLSLFLKFIVCCALEVGLLFLIIKRLKRILMFLKLQKRYYYGCG